MLVHRDAVLTYTHVDDADGARLGPVMQADGGTAWQLLRVAVGSPDAAGGSGSRVRAPVLPSPSLLAVVLCVRSKCDEDVRARHTTMMAVRWPAHPRMTQRWETWTSLAWRRDDGVCVAAHSSVCPLAVRRATAVCVCGAGLSRAAHVVSAAAPTFIPEADPAIVPAVASATVPRANSVTCHLAAPTHDSIHFRRNTTQHNTTQHNTT
jgi:hypothetical protein